MDTEEACNVCDGTSFTINAGFYYCDTCGTQAAQKQEVEDLDDGGFAAFEDRTHQSKHKIKKATKIEVMEMTTWEAYNYILYGFVNELLNLGSKDELMLTTLQLWAAYLRKNEVAFYGKKETNLPKFNFKYKRRDVRIIYNLPTKKRKRNTPSIVSDNHAPRTVRQEKLAYSKKKRSLASAEYDDYMSSQKTDISSVGFNLSQRSSTCVSSDATDNSCNIRYSRRTKRKAQIKMTREHLAEHQNDLLGQLKCHKMKEAESIGRPFVYAVLWLALNHIDDDVQLSDLMRYIKESHIKFNDVSSFFPDNVNATHAVNNFRKSSDEFLSHLGLRVKALAIARTINIRHLRMPDLSKLVRRYVEEFCLPSAVAEFADKLLAFCPPQMKIRYQDNPSMAVPNYEGRAMAYIIFVLKLFFGIDNQREHKISNSAKKLNDKLTQINPEQSSLLFVYTDWMQYMDMRNVIVAQCHFATAMHLDPTSERHSNFFIDFFEKATEGNARVENYRKVQMENIKTIFEQVLKLHEDTEDRKPSVTFPPTLTPFNTYMTFIEANASLKSKIHIPEYMNIRHENRDMVSYLKPKSLKTYLRKHNTNLKLNYVECNPEVDLEDVTYINKKMQCENVRFDFDITEGEWQDLLNENRETAQKRSKVGNKMTSNAIKKKVQKHLHSLKAKEDKARRARKDEQESVSSQLNRSPIARPSKNPDSSAEADKTDISDIFSMHSFQYFDELGKDIQNDFDHLLREPRRNLDQQANICNHTEEQEIITDDETDIVGGDSMDLDLSNFDYWICMENIYFLTIDIFEKRLNRLPSSFQWLLKHCAMHLHMQPKDLYIELLAIESQFRYVLKPIFKMNSSISYREISREKLGDKTFNAVNLLKRIW